MPAYFRKNSGSSETSATRASDRSAAKKETPVAAAAGIPSPNNNNNDDDDGDNDISRVSLHRRPSSMGSQYQTTCISKHYALNHKVYEAFKANFYNLSSVVDTSRKSQTSAKSNFEWISGAFCLGYSFVETALLELPRHGYFYSNEDPKLVRLRKRSSLAALEVVRLLQRIVKLMAEATGWRDSFSVLSSASMTLEPDDPKALLLEGNREECKRRLSTLKQLAREQSERLDTYEAMRRSVLAEWGAARPEPSNNNSGGGSSGNHRHKTGNNRGGGSTATRITADTTQRKGSKSKTAVVVGNHRGSKRSSKTVGTGESSTTATGPAGPVDCEVVGETLLSCSRLFCPGPAPLSEVDVPRSIAVTRKDASSSSTPVFRTFPNYSLADQTQDSDSDHRSELAVFDAAKSGSPASADSSGGGSKDATASFASDNSDDAVFQSPPTSPAAVKSDEAVTNEISPNNSNKPKTTPATRKPSGAPTTDGNRSSDSCSTSDTASTRSGGRLRRKPRKNRAKKKPSGGGRGKKDSSTKNAFNRLFGKKSPSRPESAPGGGGYHQSAAPLRQVEGYYPAAKSREQTEIEEALYQSELEAAKAASMREEEQQADDPIVLQQLQLQHYANQQHQQHRVTNNTGGSCGGERDSPSSPPASLVGPPPPTSGATMADAEDYDLQRALYLSGLEVTKPDGTHWNPREPREHEDNRHLYRELLATEEQEEEKRDDSAGEGQSVRRRHATTTTTTSRGGTAQAPIVVRCVPVSSDPVVAKGRPVAVRSPDPFNALRIVRGCCRKDFERLRNSGKISVGRVPTYQGRTQDSTNGCTVIAPLLCVHHFRNRGGDAVDATTTTTNNKATSSQRIPDSTVASVIDDETPAILPVIRKSLGVSKNAFLIPHDAHEALIESERMSRDQFVTVCGGNILEDRHLGSLIKELSRVLPDGKKLGATYFFHQHVIAILQLRGDAAADGDDDDETVSFDVIDSFPNKATFETLQPQKRPEPSSSSPEPSTSDDPNRRRNCARVFCKDASSLKAYLKWYACSVFTPENERYIDTYHWDEKLTDFDPRVFQAFLWKET